MQIIALDNLSPNDEILTSYVDLSIPRHLRQAELFDRYRFHCDCALCDKSKDPSWLDPRESLMCVKKGCDGMAKLPDLSREDQEVEVKCIVCSQRWTVSCKDQAEELRVGQSVLDALERSSGESKDVRLFSLNIC